MCIFRPRVSLFLYNSFMNLIVDGLDVAVKDEGKGPIILMLHGWKSDFNAFDSLAEKLVESNRVIRPNLPGFGSSQTPPTDWGVPEYAQFVNAYLKKMKATEIAAIVGHSMGGRIAMYGLAHQEFVAPKLVLLGSAGVPPSKTPKSISYWLAAKLGRAATIFLPRSLRHRLRQRLYHSAGSTDYLHSGELRQIFSNMIKEDAREYAGKIKSQTLLVYGKNDTEAPPEFGETFHQLIPRSELLLVPNAGHYVHHDQAQLVERKIQEFLA